MNVVPQWVVESLGCRVVLTSACGGFPRGRTGLLVSIQSGWGPDRSHGNRYATVAFEDWEENVPFDILRPMQLRG